MPENGPVLKDSILIGTLCAYYGKLLTPLQLEAVRLHYLEDLTLSEIALQQHSTRQSVHEAIKRSVEKLQEYEEKLHLIENGQRTVAMLAQAEELCRKGDGAGAGAIIRNIIRKQEGDDEEYGL